VPLGRNHARPRCTVRARPAATRGTTCVHDAGAAHVRGGGTARRRAARRRRCSVSRRRHGAGARETAGNGGSPARRRRRGVTAMGERRETAMDPGVGGFGPRRKRGERSGRRRCVRGGREVGGADEVAVGGERRERGGCREAWCAVPTAALSRGVWQPRGSGARRLTGGARSSAICE
jgi:hypothetical protein